MSEGTATLTPCVMNHAKKACLLCHRNTFPLLGLQVTFIGG